MPENFPASSFFTTTEKYRSFCDQLPSQVPTYIEIAAGLSFSSANADETITAKLMNVRIMMRISHLITLCAIRSDNIFREYYLRRVAEGLPKMKALMATTHKLIRVIFSMLTHRMPFKKEVAAV